MTKSKDFEKLVLCEFIINANYVINLIYQDDLRRSTFSSISYNDSSKGIKKTADFDAFKSA